MTFIPQKALELQPFTCVKEFNYHMSLHYIALESLLTRCIDSVFHLIKKYACRVAGVCWLKQEKLAELAKVSVKTVERAVKFLKDHGVVKIYHTKQSNGLNGHSYYVLQPFRGELVVNEEIVCVEEGDGGAEVEAGSGVGTGVADDFLEEKLLSSNKALLNSSKALRISEYEEDYNHIARAGSVGEGDFQNRGFLTRENYRTLVRILYYQHFSEADAKSITTRVFDECEGILPSIVFGAYGRALRKYRERRKYPKPIYSVVEYFVKLVLEGIEGGAGKDVRDEVRVNGGGAAGEGRRRELLDWMGCKARD
jgi:hypothetical protein